MAEDATVFALAEYQVPKHGQDPSVSGGTMPKAPKDKGGLFTEVTRLASCAPGPEKYHKDILERNFVGHMKGGKFSDLGRNWGSSPKSSPRGVAAPSVGTYQIEQALDKTKPRPRGGQITKGDRRCFFAVQAAKNSIPAPGKYEPKKMEAHLDSPVFASPRSESRSPKKQSPMGPGYYNPQFYAVERTVLTYSGSKESSKSYLDQIMGKKDKTPPPGHVGIPDSKWEDRQGAQLHAARLLLDRHVSPRTRAIDGASPRGQG